MPPRRSKRKSKSRSSQQTLHNNNLRTHLPKSNAGLAEQIVNAQALYGLGSVRTVHRDKSKLQRYSPPLTGDTGEI